MDIEMASPEVQQNDKNVANPKKVPFQLSYVSTLKLFLKKFVLYYPFIPG